MAKAPKKPPPEEDQAQSQRFLETAKALEDAGELSPTDDGGAFERLMGKVAPPRRKASNEPPK
jgi:hypothetical protein